MIRAILDSLGLETVPDFRAGSLDDPLLLCLKSAESSGNVFNDGHASQGSLFPKNGSAVGPLDRVPVVPKAVPPPTVRPDIKQQLLAHGAVVRLLKNQQWAQPAHAAIAHFTEGKPCPVSSWQRSSTWQQVQMAFNEIISSRV